MRDAEFPARLHPLFITSPSVRVEAWNGSAGGIWPDAPTILHSRTDTLVVPAIGVAPSVEDIDSDLNV